MEAVKHHLNSLKTLALNILGIFALTAVVAIWMPARDAKVIKAPVCTEHYGKYALPCLECPIKNGCN